MSVLSHRSEDSVCNFSFVDCSRRPKTALISLVTNTCVANPSISHVAPGDSSEIVPGKHVNVGCFLDGIRSARWYPLLASRSNRYSNTHDDVIKWKYFPRYWSFVRGIHRSPVNSPHKGQWRGALMFSLICARINSWVNNGEAGDLRRHRGHFDVIVMLTPWRKVDVLSR